jgi:hypothetical protein
VAVDWLLRGAMGQLQSTIDFSDIVISISWSDPITPTFRLVSDIYR